MDKTSEQDVGSLPLVPRNPLPFRQQMKAIREYHIGQELLRDSGGPVTRVTLGPKWLTGRSSGSRHRRVREMSLDAKTMRATGPPFTGKCAT